MVFQILFILIAFSSLSFDIYSWIHKNVDRDIHHPVFISLIAKLMSLSILSFAYFFALLTKISFLLVFLVLIAVVSFLNRKNKLSFNDIRQDLSKIDFRSLLFFWILMLISFPLIVKYITYSGLWDAWAIWLPHAKFLASDNWDLFFRFTPQIGAHPDYPLMLPTWIAMGWKVTHSTGQIVPLIVGSTVFIFILIFAFISQKNYQIGFIFVSLLVFNSTFLKWSFAGYSDVMLALYFLVAVMSYEFYKNDFPKLMWIPGFFASSSAWVKNEGLLFFLIFTILLSIRYFRRKKLKFFKFYVFGSIIPLIFIFWFKTLITTQNDLVSSWHQTFIQLVDWQRYQTIFRFLYHMLLNYFSPILVLLFLLIFSRRYIFFKKIGFLTLFLLWLGYILVYVMSPAGLEWHIQTSMDRLITQIYPAFLFLALKKLA